MNLNLPDVIFQVGDPQKGLVVLSVPKTEFPRDPGSPSENGFMEPKYYALRR